jgi:hypothetical protein
MIVIEAGLHQSLNHGDFVDANGRHVAPHDIG